MLTISKPLSAGQAQRYHAEEFQNARDNYYTEGDVIRGVWHGQLAERWGLAGNVREDQFKRLAEGQHPITGDQLVRHQTARETKNARGETVTTMEHRAGWDATFSAPKSVSLTALVGGDQRVGEAHRESVRVALRELEPYTQARLGGNRRPDTTGNAVMALFEHDSARPVNGYAAPQLHTHAVVFNLTETADGTVRPLQPRELYRSQQYATAVYRSELAARLNALGYEIERGRSGQPEIRGYSHEYLDASSPRRQQIEKYLAEADRQGAAAAQIAAHQTREAKLHVSHDEMQQRHQEVAERFGNEPTQVVEAAEHRPVHHLEHEREKDDVARRAVTFARDRNLEREAVVEERAILRDALQRSLGETRFDDIKLEVDRRVERGDFVAVQQEQDGPGRSFTTPSMIELERETVDHMRAGQGQHAELVSDRTRETIAREYDDLNDSQLAAVQEILANRDQVVALEGAAGTGKTTTLAAVRDAAEREGYQVEGFAPTSRAAHKLAEAGIETSTIQHHLARGDDQAPAADEKRLYVLDESSLASTKQMHAFLERLRPDDRVLLVGDVRQHEAVDAGRPYHQLQEAGIRTAHLDEIVRQRDPELKAVVEQLSRGDVHGAVERLDHQGRVHEIAPREERLAAIANEYVKDPQATLVVSPDNQSRQDLNEVIHRAMQREGHVDRDEHRTPVLAPRQEITGADRQWAERYEQGDVIRYSRGSKALGIEAADYARVEGVDTKNNVPHVTLKSIAQDTDLDPVFARHEPILEATLSASNVALKSVTEDLRRRLAGKLLHKQKTTGKRSLTEADRRRWDLPKPGAKWEHWEMPFDVDSEWPKDLANAVIEYRKAWRAKMDEVNARIEAHAEPERMVDQPEVVRGILRVSGPFTVEAVQPAETSLGLIEETAQEPEFGGAPTDLGDKFTLAQVDFAVQNVQAYLAQMIQLLRTDGVRFPKNRQMQFTRLESLGDASGLHAEGRWADKGGTDPDPEGRATVVVSFGPQYGPVTAPQVAEVVRAANRRGYDNLVIAGFSFDGAAQTDIEESQHPKLHIDMAHIRPDVNPGMKGLLKEQPNSQLFSVFGQPRSHVTKLKDGAFTVTMEGVDIYDPVTNTLEQSGATKVAAWFIDGDYDGATFCITQAFFPNRDAWEKIARALKTSDAIDENVFEKLAGTTSLPFPAGKHQRVAVKVIDPRGNEVMQVHRLE